MKRFIEWFKGLSRLWKIIVSTVTLLFFCCVCALLLPTPEPTEDNSVSQVTFTPSPTEPTDNSISQVTFTPSPTEPTTEESTPAPTHTSEEPTPTYTHTPISPTNTPKPTPTTRPTNTPVVAQVEVTSSSINLRSGPGVNFEAIEVGFAGDAYTVIGTNQDESWYNIRLDDGSRAWVGASVVQQVNPGAFTTLEIVATIPAPPVVQAPAPSSSSGGEQTQLPPTQPPAPSPAQVQIVSVNKSAEYVDIFNSGGTDQNLDGWVLISERGNQDCRLSGVLPAGATLRIWAMSEDADKGGFNCGHRSHIWNNSEPDPAALYDNAGNLVSRR